MKNKRIKKKITAFSATALVAAAIVALNAVAGIIASKTDFAIDLTRAGILEFSPLTEEVIENLEDEVRIVSVIPETFSDSYGVAAALRMMLKKYDTSSDKIKYSVVDTAKNPTFTQKYKLPDGSAISGDYYIFVENDGEYRVIDLSDMVSMGDDYTLFSAEQKITSAIENLTGGSSTKIYYTENHGERMSIYNSGDYLIGDYVSAVFADEYFEFETLNLSESEVPPDASVIMCVAPHSDFSEAEIQNLDLYLKNGGSMIFMPDSQLGVSAFEKLAEYFSLHGVRYKDSVAADEKSNNYFGQNPYYVIAEQAEFAETAKLAEQNAHIASPLSLCMEITDPTYASVLLATSEKGFSVNFESGEQDGSGVMNIAAVTEGDDGGTIMLFGTKDILSAYYMNGSGFGNKNFLINSVKYLSANGGIISIGPKDLSPIYLDIPSSQVKIIAVVTVSVIPLLIFAVGFAVYRKRRNM